MSQTETVPIVQPEQQTPIEKALRQRISTITALTVGDPSEREGKVNRAIKQIVTAMATVRGLSECSLGSIALAACRAVQLDLDMSRDLGQCWIIPRGGEANFQLGYRGMVALAYRNPRVKQIDAQIVYKNDRFEWTEGDNQSVTHVPAPLDKDRGPIIGAYARAELEGSSRPVIRVMRISELEAIAAKTKNPVYKEHPGEMYRKAPLSRLWKWLPLSAEMREAAEIDGDKYEDAPSVDTPARRTLSERLTQPAPSNAKQLPAADIAEDTTDYGDPSDILAGTSPNVRGAE